MSVCTNSFSRLNSTPIASYASTLPADVLFDIFLTVRDVALDENRTDFDFDKNKTYPALVLSHVCSSWRNAALAYPLLWTVIHVSPPWKFELIHAYLSRSRPCTIAVRITGHVGIPAFRQRNKSIGEADSMYSDVLSEHLCRCHTLSVEAHDDDFRITLKFCSRLSEMTASFPFLTSLSLQSFTERRTVRIPAADWEEMVGHHLVFPVLTEIKLATSFLPPTFHNISSLHILADLVNFPRFVLILEQCRDSLTDLAIYDEFWGGDFEYGFGVYDMNTTARIVLPHLNSIQFNGNIFFVSELLLLLVAPLLRELTIAPVGMEDLDKFYFVQKEQAPRFPSMKAVTLGYNMNLRQDGHVLSLAPECFPGVEEFMVVGNDILDVAKGLIVNQNPDGETVAWPGLRRLVLREVDYAQGHCTEEALRMIIESRARAGIPLEEVYLHPNSARGLRDIEWFREQVVVIERDMWIELRKRGMFYPHRTFGISISEKPC